MSNLERTIRQRAELVERGERPRDRRPTGWLSIIGFIFSLAAFVISGTTIFFLAVERSDRQEAKFVRAWSIIASPAYRDGNIGLSEALHTLTERERVEQVGSLVGINLLGRTLVGVNFDGLDLRGANFKDPSLFEVTFRGSLVRGARFDGATIEDTDFREAELDDADFGDAVIFTSDFARAKLLQARFDCTSFQSVDFTGAVFDWGFQGARFYPFNGAQFFDVTFDDIRIVSNVERVDPNVWLRSALDAANFVFAVRLGGEAVKNSETPRVGSCRNQPAPPLFDRNR